MNPVPVLPETLVVKIGGQSILDRGGEALHPVLDELVQVRDTGRDVLICAGGGTRARSAYSLCVGLRLPTGVLAAVGARVPIQNARIVQALLASRGGVFVDPEDFAKLPLLFRSGCIAIMGGMPPYSYWEMRDQGSRVPPHRTDAGTFLTAEYLGAPSCLFVKDEDGLFTDDPKRNPDAEHIPAVHAGVLASLGLVDVVLERRVIDYLPHAVWCRRLQIVNGLVPGEIIRAAEGDDNGSVIVA